MSTSATRVAELGLTLDEDLASAYIISANPRPDLALHHLKCVLLLSVPHVCVNNSPCSIASSLSPEDPEIAFNLAAVLEAGEH